MGWVLQTFNCVSKHNYFYYQGTFYLLRVGYSLTLVYVYKSKCNINRSTKRAVYTASESDVALDNDTYQNLLRSNKFKCIGPVAVRLVRLVSFRLFYSIQQHSVSWGTPECCLEFTFLVESHYLSSQPKPFKLSLSTPTHPLPEVATGKA